MFTIFDVLLLSLPLSNIMIYLIGLVIDFISPVILVIPVVFISICLFIAGVAS